MDEPILFWWVSSSTTPTHARTERTHNLLLFFYTFFFCLNRSATKRYEIHAFNVKSKDKLTSLQALKHLQTLSLSSSASKQQLCKMPPHTKTRFKNWFLVYAVLLSGFRVVLFWWESNFPVVVARWERYWNFPFQWKTLSCELFQLREKILFGILYM